MKTIHLFCLPFAGGNRYSYRAYEEKTPAGIRLLPLEYPGRGMRTGERLITDMQGLVDDLYEQLKNRIDNHPYAIYGHSLGALAGLLLVRRIVSEDRQLPLHFFATGTSGPSAYARRRVIRHRLPKEAFIREIKELEGSPELLKHEELVDYFEPIIRADFQAAETYEYTPFDKLRVPVTVITGTDEDMTLSDVQTWQEEAENEIDFISMPGKHFFIFQHAAEIMEIVKKKITSAV